MQTWQNNGTTAKLQETAKTVMACCASSTGQACVAAQHRTVVLQKKESLPNTVAQQSRCREQHMRHCMLCQQHMLQPQMQLRNLKSPISNRTGDTCNRNGAATAEWWGEVLTASHYGSKLGAVRKSHWPLEVL